MGTPAFAVASLDALVKAGCQIVGVVTAPDKPAGRGMNPSQSEVKKYAIQNGLNVLQPEKLKSPQFLEDLRSLKADVQVVVAFRMLPEAAWSMPPMGTINVHGSLLPNYRGAAPINWAIINGETLTGVTTFQLQQVIDTGDILLQKPIEIGPNETASELHDRMKIIGADILVATLNGIVEGTLKPSPQPESTSSLPAPKIFTDTCEIDWTSTVKKIIDQVRGLANHPAAFSYLNAKKIKIFSATGEVSPHQQIPGSIETDKRTFLKYACADGYVKLADVQLEGKKRMDIIGFLNGYRW